MVGADKIGGGRNEEISTKGFSVPNDVTSKQDEKPKQAPESTSAKVLKKDTFIPSSSPRAKVSDVTSDAREWASGLSDDAGKLLRKLTLDKILKRNDIT